jgi:hypothetical protein
VITNDVRNADRREESDFIERSIFLLLTHLRQLNRLDGVKLSVGYFFCEMDCTETARTQLLEVVKIFLGELWGAHNNILEVFIEEIR